MTRRPRTMLSEEPALAASASAIGSKASHSAGAGAGAGLSRRASAPLTTFLFVLLIIFLVVFPKGGIKIGGVPITIGYVILGLITALSYLRFLQNINNLPLKSLKTWVLTLPFQFIVLLTFYFLGFRGGSVAIGLAVLVTFVFMPNAFYFLLAISVARLDPNTIKRTLVLAIRFVCVFGITIFLIRTFFGYTVEIPFLTVNLDDVNALETKNNTRGALFKLISTYNNGNILGTCLGMMIPLYHCIEKRKEFFFLAVLCMILTLSRTAWASLILAMMAIAWVDSLKPSRLIGLGLFGLFLVAALPLVMDAMGRDVSFLADSNLGGRSEQLAVFGTFHLEPIEGLGTIYEITYASIYRNYGWIGLILFVVYLAAPIAVILNGPFRNRPFNRAAAGGLGVYMITALSDGCTILIPTMALYSLIAVLGLEVDDQSAPADYIAPVETPAAPPAGTPGWRRPSRLRQI